MQSYSREKVSIRFSRKLNDSNLWSCSYLARLEHRIQDIEASVRRLETNRSNGSSSGPSEPVQSSNSREDTRPPSNNGLMLPTPPKSDVPVRSNHVAQDRAEFGEIDVSENPIDGMGAINFTDEEDCGFFGILPDIRNRSKRQREHD